MLPIPASADYFWGGISSGGGGGTTLSCTTGYPVLGTGQCGSAVLGTGAYATIASYQPVLACTTNYPVLGSGQCGSAALGTGAYATIANYLGVGGTAAAASNLIFGSDAQDDVAVRGASSYGRLNLTEQTLLGRITGRHVAPLSVAEVQTLLGLGASAYHADAYFQLALTNPMTGPGTATAHHLLCAADTTGNVAEDCGARTTDNSTASHVLIKDGSGYIANAASLADVAYLPLAGGTMTHPMIGPTPAAGANGYASIRMPHGADPTTNLTNGDCWTTTSGLYCRINGSTVGPYSTGGGSIAGSTGATDNALLRADGTGGATVQASTSTLSDTGTLSLAKVSGQAGSIVAYDDYSTELYGDGWMGSHQTGALGATRYYQFPTAANTAGQYMVFGTPAAGISIGTWATPKEALGIASTGIPYCTYSGGCTWTVKAIGTDVQAYNANTAIGPGTSTAHNYAKFASTDGKTLEDGGVPTTDNSTASNYLWKNGSGQIVNVVPSVATTDFLIGGNLGGQMPITTLATAGTTTLAIDSIIGRVYRISTISSINLPQGTIGRSAIFRLTGAYSVTLKPGTNDHFVLGGTNYALGSVMSSATPAIGSFVVILYGAASVWEVYGSAGSWTVN